MKILKFILLSTLLLTITLVIVFSQKDIPLNKLKESLSTQLANKFFELETLEINERLKDQKD